MYFWELEINMLKIRCDFGLLEFLVLYVKKLKVVSVIKIYFVVRRGIV